MKYNLFWIKWIVRVEADSVCSSCSVKNKKCGVFARYSLIRMWSVVEDLEDNWIFVAAVEQTVTFRSLSRGSASWTSNYLNCDILQVRLDSDV